MNNFALILVIPTLLTAITASTLYFSFKGKIDASGRYFLLAEFLWLVVLIFTIVLNAQVVLAKTMVLYVFTACALMTEVAVLLSIKSLTQKILIRKFIFWILFVLAYCGLIEYCRNFIDPKSPLLLISFFSLYVTFTTYIRCIKTNHKDLEENLFIKWIAYTELGLTVIHVIRFASFFSDSPMMAINPNTLPILIFSLWLSINLFRYFSYQSLRISWVDPRATSDNPLNRHLTKLVNEKNQFLQGLISSNRALGVSALANSLAHQLSQPITGVILQTESVKRSLVELGSQQKLVQILNTVTEQLSKLSILVNNLRKLFGTHELEFRPFNIQEVCDEILVVIKPTLESKNISLIKHYGSSPIAAGNPIHIQQVLINLFNNAMDAIENTTTQNREISLKISQDPSFAIITIEDTGSGIAANIESTMFDLYQSTKQEGLGIGLWLSKTIIDKHEGIITAINRPEGGAIFEIRLPLAKKTMGLNNS